MADRAPLLLALAATFVLPLAGLAFIWAIARAPDDHTGRILVMFQDQPADTVAYQRIASSGARPIRVIGSVDGWIAEAESQHTVTTLRQQYGASWVFRDIGLGRALAGCLGLATGPVRHKGMVP
jgi:hypothetical protein